ncbi:S-layer homology domain-containing protein [Paenibacillus sp. CAU 1782]
MKKKPILILAITALMMLVLGQSVFAFSDTGSSPNAEKIKALKERGLLSGTGNDQFKPDGELTYAAAISLLVKAFDLNIDNIRFVKKPLATDSFPNLSNDAWYSEAFIIAQLNGLEIPRDIKANDPVTKEQFAHHLFQAIQKTGDYAFIEMYILVKDEADVNPDYMNSIQKLLLSKFAELDKDNNFLPKKVITRGEAAGWLFDGLTFVEDHAIVLQPYPIYDTKLDVKAVNSDINKVTVSAELPHPGYGLRISSIVFDGDQAIIYTEPTLPDPDSMYPQVITTVEVTTYVDAAFKPVLANGQQSMEGSSGEDQPISEQHPLQ